ncbi:MAG: hypothetical protein P8J89_00310 [Phycisphaerales bacterium]|nr:hypothetical protein [Phycisphaerales bacterium]|tara:strand:+ start:2657 stop:3229 length:573 start_codon:yes stop_codon:yes gene_type:complete
MSIIVAIQRNGVVTMGADSLTCFGDGEMTPEQNCRTRKIFTMGESFIGGTGWAVYDDIIDHWMKEKEPPALDSKMAVFSFFLELWRSMREGYPFVNDQANSKDTPFTDLDSSFLVASKGGLFKVSSDLGVTEFKRYASIGSGSEYAIGAIEALWDRIDDDQSLVTAALETACRLDVHCGGSLDLVRVPTS